MAPTTKTTPTTTTTPASATTTTKPSSSKSTSSSSSSKSTSPSSSSSSSSSSFPLFQLLFFQKQQWNRWWNILARALQFDSQPSLDTFPELAQLVIWWRAILAMAYGMFLGWDATRGGAAGILLGLNVITFVPMMYCTTYLRANAESYGLQLVLGGVAPALALMLLVWIFCFTRAHEGNDEDDNSILGGLTQLVNTTLMNALMLAVQQQQQGQQQQGQQEDLLVPPDHNDASRNTASTASASATASAYNSATMATFTLTIPPIIPNAAESEF